MRLAKQHIDVGAFTNQTEAMLAFWQNEAGLPFEELLPIGGGVRQHRHAMNGSVFKLNDARDPLPDEGPSGYSELLIATPGHESELPLTDPDGNRVRLVTPGWNGVEGIGVRLRVRDAAAHRRFYREALELKEFDDNSFRCGDSLLFVTEDAAVGEVGKLQARGYRYITMQVWDVDEAYAAIVAQGGNGAREPFNIGTTARIAWVRDPDGNWIEISQRASLTGPLPA
ncbi:MAG: VOC family protein [Dehalococcoidia bacterium]